MKFLEIFRFEFLYQIRRPWPWLAFGILMTFALLTTRVGIVPVTLPQDFILNSPFIIAAVTVITCQVWLLVAAATSGEAAARDVYTGMHPLIHTTPASKAEYLTGRFLAACAIHALILLGPQVGSLLAVYGPGANPDFIGPFRPAAHLAAYALIALPTIFVATTFQFAVSLLSGRIMAAYAASMMLFFLSYPVTLFLYLEVMGPPAVLADPIGVFAIMNTMMTEWTIVEKNVRMFTLEGMMLWNRLIWAGIAAAVLAGTYARFEFVHRGEPGVLSRLAGRLRQMRKTRKTRKTPEARGTRQTQEAREMGRRTQAPDHHRSDTAVRVPSVPLSFGAGTHVRQLMAVAGSSFRMAATSPAGLFLLVVFPAFLVLVIVVEMEHWGVPVLPHTSYILPKHMTATLTHYSDYRVIIPLMILFIASELVWRQRDAGVHEQVDATPTPNWVLSGGTILGLGLLLGLLMVALAAAGMAAQTLVGFHDYRIGLYLQILFGLQLPEYLLLAVLAVALHVVVNNKHMGMVAALMAYVLMLAAPFIGLEHNLLVYGAGPAWSFTEMRGYAGSVGPWLWFRLYWAAWAVLLMVATTLFWVRGRESGFGARLRAAQQRATAGAAVVAMALIVGLGGFIFYNTNVLNEYAGSDEMVRRRAEYELRYGRYENTPQPDRVATKLDIEIYPDRNAATVRGSYTLLNRGNAPIGAVHVEPAFYVETDVSFDRPYRHAVADDRLGHHIYELVEPLQPGDSLTLSFEVRLARRGFEHDGARMHVVANGSYFAGGALPVIGYHPLRVLWSAADRQKYGLPRRVTLPAPSDIDPAVAATSPYTFEAIVGTVAGQVAVAPGELRRTWTENGRSYFHYASDVPISGTEVFFSADYMVHRERWNHVDLQLFLHPGHTANLERVLRSVRASLDYFSQQFGPYPYAFLQVVEQPGNFLGMGVESSGVITGGEGIFLLNPRDDGLDVISEIVAHEVGHQWWGMQLRPAFAEGGGLISESLAWYSAMQLVQHDRGRESLRRLMARMREPNPWPPIRTGLPLLRAMDPWANYRKGPFAFHALSVYAGEERVNTALASLIRNSEGGLATSLDLYRELQAVMPDSLKPLLHDLFEVNTAWTFATRQATAMKLPDGKWEVTLELDARKTLTDSAGVEIEVPITEAIEIGVFAAGQGRALGPPLHLEKHHIRSGRQSITVVVTGRPAQAGVDPYSVLDWKEGNNIRAAAIVDREADR
jgi:ABC-2 type transport system permease protein